MNDFTLDDLRTILHWGIDRCDSVGINRFKEEGHDEVYMKICEMIADYDKPSSSQPQQLDAI